MKKQLLVVFGLIGVTNFGIQAQTNQSQTQERTSLTIGAIKKSPPRSVAKAGTLVWGAGAATGNSDGQFANPFVQAGSYSPGDNPTAWTALSVNESGGMAQPGNAYWVRSLLGYSQGAYAGPATPISSPSQANGVALFDSDFLDNAGVAGAFGTGTSPSAHRGELISPRIDLTGYTDTALSVSLYAFYRDFLITELSVSLSTDDGSTWTAIDYRQLIGNLVEGSIDVTFPLATSGVANLTQCRLKLTFDGDYYFALVDDISIKTAANYDLALGVVDEFGATFAETGDFVNITSNRYFPVSQLAQDVRHFGFGANIRNFGIVDILPSDSAFLLLAIEKDIAGTWTTVYNDSTAADTILAGGFTTLTDEITDYSWVEAGDYRATYSTVFDGVDGNTSNNSLEHYFTITPNDYASLVDLDTSGYPTATQGIFPGGGPYSKFEYGSVFYFDDATATSLSLDSLSFVYRLISSFSPANVGANQTLLASVYQVDPSTGVLDDPTLLTQIGIGTINLTGLGTTVAPGSYGTARCTSFVDAGTGGPMPTLTTGHYYVSIVIEPSLFGGPTTFSTDDVPWLGASTLSNYSLNVAETQPNQMINVSPLNLVDGSGVQTMYWTGFGATIVPSIGLHLSGEFCSGGAITSQPIDQLLAPGANAVFTFTETLTAPTYQWQLNDGTGFVDLTDGGQYSGVTTTTLTVSSVTLANNTDNFRCIVTESSNCVDTTDFATLEVQDDSSIDELDNINVKLYPNPTNGTVTLAFNNKMTGNILISNVIGQEIFKTEINSTTLSLDLHSLSSRGTFFLHVIDSNGTVRAVKKLIYQ